MKWVRSVAWRPLLVGVLLACLSGCEGRRDAEPALAPAGQSPPGTASTQTGADSGEDPNIRRWEQVDDLPRELAVFRSVFWAPEDTHSLRAWLRQPNQVRGQRVLEIGTGSGLVALCCLQAGAAHVVATDVNTEALANAAYNAERMQVAGQLETRLVSPQEAGAYQVIGSDERFDLIVSNPPWENGEPVRVQDAAFYDPGFQLLQSLIRDGKSHLRPAGRIALAYGCRTAIERARQLAAEHGYAFVVHDTRPLETLSEVFVPGMLVELVPQEAR